MTRHRAAIIEAIDALVEANTAVRRARALAPLERTLTAALTKAFRAEEQAVLKGLRVYRGRFPANGALREAADDVPLERVHDAATKATAKAYQQPLAKATGAALQSGMESAAIDLSASASFSLRHPEAARYIQEHGAERMPRIWQTTREGLRGILAQAAEEGWGYDETAKAIRQRYRHMSKTRARNIAVFELGDAYTAGEVIVARELQAAGLEMQHAWGTSRDERVRPAHAANEAEGWLPLDQAFSSGDERPPTDPQCRCYLKTRRKPESEA